MRTRRTGFTLVELLVVIAIIGMLMGLLLPAINGALKRARVTTCLNNVRQFRLGVVNYATSKQYFPGFRNPACIFGDFNKPTATD